MADVSCRILAAFLLKLKVGMYTLNAHPIYHWEQNMFNKLG